MHSCFYPQCKFQTTDECYLSLHLALEHSSLLPGATQELHRQLSMQLQSSTSAIVIVKLMRQSMLPKMSATQEGHLLQHHGSYSNHSLNNPVHFSSGSARSHTNLSIAKRPRLIPNALLSGNNISQV